MDKYEYFWTCIRGNYLPTELTLMAKNITGKDYSYEEIMGMKEGEIREKTGLTEDQIKYFMSTKEEMDIDEKYDEFIKSGACAVTVNDEGYPDRLRYIENRPYALFYYGNMPDENKRTVAIVGARKCSEYGRFMAEKIAGELGQKGINVISGMAYGVDGIAQAAALNSGGKSYGVIGSGVDICYPRANRLLYENLKKSGGIISEYPIMAPAKPENFPYRNRIISGLADILVVVEARLKSGTFITVDYALSQGREIMVVPGRATDPLSTGCNALLSQGAHPVQDAGDVIRLLDTISADSYTHNNRGNSFRTSELIKYVPKASEKILLEREENMVYSVLDFYALSPEDIMEAAKLDIFSVMNALVSLELKGLIREKGKNLYVKCR